MSFKHHILLRVISLCTLCICAVTSVFAQKPDSIKVSLRPKSTANSRFGNNKSSILHLSSLANATNPPKSQKSVTILKIYPNPISNQFNINFRLEKENSLSIKITDILGNEVITLMNERMGAGEFTKTFVIPQKLNSGIYFLRIVAGGEPVIKRISVI